MPTAQKESILSTDTRPNLNDAVKNLSGAVETVKSHLHPQPSWDLARHPVPKGREEVWRFTPVRLFRPLFDEKAPAGELEWDADLPDGVTIRKISKEEAKALAIEPPIDRVSALAVELADHATLIDVAADAELDRPALITLKGTGQTAHTQTIIRIGAHAKATFAVRHEGSAVYANKTDVLIGDGANVNLVSVHDWADDAVHGGQTTLSIGRDARVRTVTTSMGGRAVRLVERAQYAGPGGDLEQFGLYFVDAGQHTEHRLFVDHNEPKTKSHVDYRGALQGEGAHSVWIGDVLIRPEAQGIETYETNKNLVLTDGCQADSVPNLEIETGDIVGAGHSSTTGRFDDLQLFYLRSRGIPEAEARRLVVHGFFVDILRRIGVESIEQRMLEEVEHELQAITAGSEA